jgi:hypothetical protein
VDAAWWRSRKNQFRLKDMSFLTKRRSSTRNADNNAFPAAQLFLLGKRSYLMLKQHFTDSPPQHSCASQSQSP